MSSRRVVTSTIAIAWCLAACATPGGGTRRDPTKASLPANLGAVRAVNCSAEQDTVQLAVESYIALNGSATMPTESQLVTSGLLLSESTAFDVDRSGNVVPAPGGPCA
jgi:hypothetical protein